VHDLSVVSGLSLTLDEITGMLTATGSLVLPEPGVRRLSELRDVLVDPMIAETDERPCYFLYRDVNLPSDQALLTDHGLRYDLTVTLPGTLGPEYLKTAGHYHSRAPDGVIYPEVYEILHGRAAFVLQWVDDPAAEHPTIRAGWIAVCDPGDKIVIPPDCGHVTVNIGDEPLVVSDLVAIDSQNDYGSFRHAHGAAYYLLPDSSDPHGFQVMPNLNYGAPPAPVTLIGSRWSPLCSDPAPVYQQMQAEPDRFAFLTSPAAWHNAMLALWSG